MTLLAILTSLAARHNGPPPSTFDSQLLHFETSKCDRVTMPRKTDMPFATVKSFGQGLDLAAVELVDVDVQNLSSVQGDLNRLISNLDLLVVPLSDRTEETMFGTDAVIERPMVLKWFQWSRVFGIVAIAVDDLDLQSIGRGVATKRCSQGDAVVSSEGQ